MSKSTLVRQSISVSGRIGSIESRKANTKYGVRDVTNMSLYENKGTQTNVYRFALWGSDARVAAAEFKVGGIVNMPNADVYDVEDINESTGEVFHNAELRNFTMEYKEPASRITIRKAA